ncbi:N-acetylmuramoyl-L-alanine amidase [Paracoccus sp. PAR01]|nr:N-acetylmuramoyl-L-alanine amidase [Paracoccus sp. PAR01]
MIARPDRITSSSVPRISSGWAGLRMAVPSRRRTHPSTNPPNNPFRPASRGPFHFQRTGMERIIMHWSAGTHAVSALDRQHYHYVIDGSGIVVEGDHAIEDNLGPLVSGRYAAHTLNCNTGSIGIALAGMARAVEAPFSSGPWPITEAQLAALVQLCAGLCRRYQIPVKRETVLSHAEVQPTLKIVQRGKWDIAWLPGMTKPGNPVEVGDQIRARIREAMAVVVPSGLLSPAPDIPPTLQRGDVGEPVRRAQALLTAKGFNLGQIDGDFGPKTRAAAVAFQRAFRLHDTGNIDAATWAALLLKGN